MSEPLRIMIIGGDSVGKTSIFRRANHEDLVDIYVPAYNEEKVNDIDIDGQNAKFIVIDTPGKDYESMCKLLYVKSDAFIFVIDISNPNSIEEFENLYTKVKEQCDHVTFSIAANKTDLRNDENSQNFISKEKLREIGEKFNSEVIEISAKEDAGIERIFNDVIRKFIKYELENSKEKKKKCQIQ